MEIQNFIKPLHPLVVHLPLGMALIAPFLFVGALWMRKRVSAAEFRRFWIVALFILIFSAVGAALGLASGEAEENLVRKVVGKNLVHNHEEKAEVFAIFSYLVAGIGLAVWFFQGSWRRIFLFLGMLVSLGMLGAAILTGKTGGELVYKHGAARAYQGSSEKDPAANGDEIKKAKDQKK